MPPYILDHTGCKAIIRDEETNETVVETTVIEYNKSTLTIIVEDTNLDPNIQRRISALILHKNAVYEYKGTTRKLNRSGAIEIALFQEQVKNERSASRYTINTPAIIEHLIIVNKLVPLNTPLNVLIINISKSGVLMKTPIGPFNIGTSFLLKLHISGSETIFHTCVARIDDQDMDYIYYGCTFQSMHS